MSHFARGTCCAVAFVLGLVLAAQMLAEDLASAPDVEHKRESFREVTEERIQMALREPLKVPLEHTEVPLQEVIDILQEEYDIPIVFDNAALDEVAISPETEITVSLRKITLRSALNHMFKQPGVEDLTYVIDNEVLLITTIERQQSLLLTRIYRIDDLEPPPPSPNGASAWADFSVLIDLLTSCVEPKSWHEHGTGGKGRVKFVKPGVLVVSQTRRVHDQIEDLLADLRSTLKSLQAEIPPGSVFTQGFRITDDFSEEAVAARQTVTKSIMESVNWGDDSNEKLWIRFLPQRILVRHRLEILRQVGPVIEQMGLNANPRHSSRAGGSGFGGGGGGGFGGSSDPPDE